MASLMPTWSKVFSSCAGEIDATIEIEAFGFAVGGIIWIYFVREFG